MFARIALENRTPSGCSSADELRGAGEGIKQRMMMSSSLNLFMAIKLSDKISRNSKP